MVRPAFIVSLSGLLGVWLSVATPSLVHADFWERFSHPDRTRAFALTKRALARLRSLGGPFEKPSPDDPRVQRALRNLNMARVLAPNERDVQLAFAQAVADVGAGCAAHHWPG